MRRNGICKQHVPSKEGLAWLGKTLAGKSDLAKSLMETIDDLMTMKDDLLSNFSWIRLKALVH
jgi:hypothetical protein